MITMYRPSQHIKTGAIQSAIQGLTQLFLKAFHKEAPETTSQQGASATASPSVYQFSLWQERYERRAVIQECRQAFDDDPRVNRSCRMFGREAIRGGVVITIQTGTLSLSDSNAAKAQKIAETVMGLVNPLLESWATYTPVEGEQFTQASIKGDVPNGIIVKVGRMPTAAMERNTDDSDEFIDPDKAFSQVDILTNGETATFPLSTIHHTRWNWVDGDRYGKSEIISIRRLRRLVMLCEDAQARRRIARAPQRVHWKFGGAIGGEIIVPPWEDIEKFKENNGFVNGIREQFDPTEVGRDTFGSLVEPIPIKGDQTVHEIDDLKYLQNVMGVGLPTPGPIYNLDATNVNRDVVEDLRAEWLKQTQLLSGKLADLVSWLMDLGLLLQGILPEAVDYIVRFSESTVETPSEMVKRVIEARAATVGTGRNAIPAPLISLNTAVRTISEHFDIKNVPDEIEAIIEELGKALDQMQQINGAPPTNGGVQKKTSASTKPKAAGKASGANAPLALANNSLGSAQILAGQGQSSAQSRGLTVSSKNQKVRRDETNGYGGDVPSEMLKVKKTKVKKFKPSPEEVTRKYTGPGQLAAYNGSMYGQPEESDYHFTGSL